MCILETTFELWVDYEVWLLTRLILGIFSISLKLGAWPFSTLVTQF
jgi:hypothetical protein